LHSSLGQALIAKVPRKIRELIKELTDAGFYEIRGGGKGSHRKFTHARYRGAVTISGQSGEDAKPYQERQVKRAVEEVLK
jgi:predicted RNA binding protein YcfA (HicA-like mRNA interferase family)